MNVIVMAGDERVTRELDILIVRELSEQPSAHIHGLTRGLTLTFGFERPIKSIPGIGAITGPLIAAELGDLRRFASLRPLHAILAYAGMDARVRKSGQWDRQN